MAPVREYNAPRSTCTAPARASQAPAFPSIARVSQDEPPWHWGGLVKSFVIKVYCPVLEFIDAVFAKKGGRGEQSLPSASTPLIRPPLIIPLWLRPLRLRPLRIYPSDWAPTDSPLPTPPPLLLPLWLGPLSFSPSDSAPSTLEGSNVKPTFFQDRKLTFCCFHSEKDRM